jgi:hypothetical protein
MGAVRNHNDVADPYQMSCLLDHNPIENNRSTGAKARSGGAAFDEAGKPEPLIKSPACPFRRTSFSQARFNSSNLAKGCPSDVGGCRQRLLTV